jgi:FtsP/CotA-like multicopper oxidase with cupredoxin domain
MVGRRTVVGGIAGVGAVLVGGAAAAARLGLNGHSGAPAPLDQGHMMSTADLTADELDRHHRERTLAFPAKTQGLGGQPLPYRLDGGVKVFELVSKVVQWEVEPGRLVEAWTYNGVVPGPEIRVTEGDRVRVILTNELPESTSIHFHGVRTPNKMDGVPFITQDPIKPGQQFIYEFTARPFGSHMYHSHHNSAKQVAMGLLGAFIIEPQDRSREPQYDREYTLILNDGPHGFTLNGKSFPATQPLTAKLGERIRIRFMHEGAMYHPMHLHGFAMQVFAKDGYPLPQPYFCDTLPLQPGERIDVLVDCDEPGVWAFHCHVLSHAEAETGMFGMVTALIVEP